MLRYCKAYKNQELRKFYASHAQPVPVPLASEGISFLWNDFIVRKGPMKQEEVIFEQVTEEWQNFCQNQLSFSLPEKISIPEQSPVADSQYSSACKTFIPFTSGQRWLIEELSCPDKFFFNVLLFQLCIKKISIQELAQILLYLSQYHDALRIKFTNQDKQWQQFIVAHDDHLPATWVCLSLLSVAEQMEILRSMSHEMQHQINTLQGSLWNFAFCEIDEDYGHILWIVNHFVTDATSNQILLQDFHTLHNQTMQGKTLKLPKQKTTFREWSERMTAYLHSSEAEQEIKEYWLKLPWEHVKPIPTDFPERMMPDSFALKPQYGIFASNDYHYFTLNPEQTRLLLNTASSRHVQLLDILITAMALTIAAWSHSNVASMFVQDHARFTTFKDISLIHTVGYIAHVRRLLFDLRTATSPEEALECVRFQMEQAPHHGRSLDWLLRQEQIPEDLKHLPCWDVYFNFGGRNATSLRSDDLSSFMLQYPDNERNHLLSCESRIVKDRLEVRWEYSIDIHQKSTIEKFASYFMDILCRFSADYALKSLI